MMNELFSRYPELTICKNDISKAFETMSGVFENGNRLFVVGNGGSASDALHIAGELVKSFVLKRELNAEFAAKADPDLLQNLQGALPAFALVENVALATAFSNDCNSAYVFAQQIYAYARKGDCVLAISTSGNSENVANAVRTAKIIGTSTVALTGNDGGKLKSLCDVCICVPESETYKIQELHLPIYHSLAFALEELFWGGKNSDG